MSQNPSGLPPGAMGTGCFTRRPPREGGLRKSPLVGGEGSSLSEFKVIWETPAGGRYIYFRPFIQPTFVGRAPAVCLTTGNLEQ